MTKYGWGPDRQEGFRRTEGPPAAEGAGVHCQLDNFPLARQIVFDWIEDRMREGER